MEKGHFCVAPIRDDVQALFITPEKLDSNYLSSFLRNNIDPQRLRFACIDEARCISEWSHNIRHSYLILRGIQLEGILA